MTEALWLTLLAFVAVIAGTLGWILGRARSEKRIVTLETTLQLERGRLAEVEKTFAVLSGEALKQNNELFLQLANETLKQFHVQAQGELAQKEKAVENLVKPIKDALDKTDQQLRQMEKERQEAYGALHKHLETLAHTQHLLQSETRNLVQALRRPEVRGQWGEMTLKRLAELAGMVEHCDFVQQESLRTEEGLLRPDMIVRLPDARDIVVDAKTPLDAYLSATEAPDDATRAHQLERHARKLRERVRELAGKAYWSQFKNAPDFVVMFVPGDQFLSAALDVDHELLEDALRNKVILATPTSFVALLRAVAFGWRQQALAANAERVREAGEEMYLRLATFTEHLAKLGRSLDTAVGDYNKAVGSFDAKVLPGARKFTEMGVSAKKSVAELAQIEKGVREVAGLPDDEV